MAKPRQLPLSALLSQALVAYTIEFDNEAEQRIPHITTVGASRAGFGPNKPWFVSQVMWTNFLRFIDAGEAGTPVPEVQALACLSAPAVKSRLHHLEWWQYVTIDKRVVRLNPGAVRACAEWKPLPALVQKRWRSRFGKDVLDALTTSLRTIVAAEAAELPDYLPVVDYGPGMRATLVMPEGEAAAAVAKRRTPVDRLDVSALLSRALLALTLEHEASAEVSLPIAANVLRVVEDGGTPLRDVPMRGGVAKEGVTAAVNFLVKKGFLTQSSDKAKLVQLTAAGKEAAAAYEQGVRRVEQRWAKAFGKATVQSLRDALEAMAAPAPGSGPGSGSGSGKDARPLLAKGLTPPDGGWRTHKAYAQRTEAYLQDPRGSLPHYPMVLHRGGFPDGS